MSDEEFEKYDSLDDLSLNNEKDSSDLDEYGVWVKKKPDALKNTSSSEEIAEVGDTMNEDNLFLDGENNDSDGEAFDFDGLSDFDVSEDSSKEDSQSVDNNKNESSNIEEKETGEASFDDIDMSDFFTDFGSDENKEEEAKEEEVALKMDLNFDNVDSYGEGGGSEDDFDSMLDEATSMDSSDTSFSTHEIISSSEEELDDLLSSPPSSTSFSSQNDSTYSDISLDVEVDEAQDFTKLSSEEDEESFTINTTMLKKEEEKPKEDDKDEIIIKNTVIEPENIEEIKKENKKVLGEDGMEDDVMNSKDSLINNALQEGIEFSDVDALAKDLTNDDLSNVPLPPSGSISGAITGSIEVKEVGNILHVEGLDKLTNLATSMLEELASIKTEIASLRQALPKTMEDGRANATFGDIVGEKGEEETGFFEDEDTDEAIALTGDELNNILITADFTEESSEDVGESDNKEDAPIALSPTSEEDASFGECEVCDDDDSFDDEFDFDNIALENAKLDDFVIPDELDYNMLRSEDNEEDSQGDSDVVKAEGEDMSYLDGKDSIDNDVSGAPETQDLPTSSKEYSSEDSSSEVLSSNIKKDIKSVLSYMDQLLESLPEDKMKEFAESEYFDMYNRLFSELGIS